MTLETLADLGHDLSVPAFVVDVGSTRYAETDGLVSEVTVDATTDGADRFELTLASRFDHESGTFVDHDWEDVPVGERVEVAMGYGSPDALPTAFVGSVTELGTDFPAGGAPTITVSGYGRYHDLTESVVSQRWEERTDAEIASSIADAYGLDPDVRDLDEGARRPVAYNAEESDAEFLESLAERNDDGDRPYQTIVRRERLAFRPAATDADPVLELRYGESLRSFSPSFTDARTLDGVTVLGWDSDGKEPIEGTAGEPDGERTRTVRRPVDSKRDAETLAERLLHERSEDRLEGQAETIGLPELDVDTTVELSGLGERFSGTYYITDVTHTIDTNGYRTRFDVRYAGEGADA